MSTGSDNIFPTIIMIITILLDIPDAADGSFLYIIFSNFIISMRSADGECHVKEVSGENTPVFLGVWNIEYD